MTRTVQDWCVHDSDYDCHHWNMLSQDRCEDCPLYQEMAVEWGLIEPEEEEE